MKTYILLALSLATFLYAKAQTITSGLQVYVPTFEERFDWSLNYGGNDGLSGLEDYTGATFSRKSMTFSDCRHGNQCVEVGTSNNSGSITISLDKAVDLFYTFRVMPYKGEKFYVNINGTKSSQISKSSFLRGKISSKKEISISSVESSYSHNFYIDDLVFYTASTDYSVLTNASRLMVTGTLNATMIAELQKIVESNTKLTSIDLNSATVSTAFALSPGNPNCLIFVPQDNYVTNTSNVVKTTTSSKEKFEIINNYECNNLAISDGYPFDAMYSFTAKKASYNRSFKSNSNGYMSSVCLPFATDKSQTGVSEAYAFAEHKNAGELEFESVEHLEANRPYVIETKVAQPFNDLKNVEVVGTTPISTFKCSANINTPDLKESVKYQFHGTFTMLQDAKSNDSQTIYGFQNGKFVYIGSDDADAVDFKPFRAYFTIANSGEAASRELQLNGVVNGIEKITTPRNLGKTDIYTAEGIRIKSKADSATIGSLPNGIYIIGNKKVMVKH